jgi:hypothetical protein
LPVNKAEIDGRLCETKSVGILCDIKLTPLLMKKLV